MNANPSANVVLVHGGFVDGSGWRAVYDLLSQDGYHVAVVQIPTLSLDGDGSPPITCPPAPCGLPVVSRLVPGHRLPPTQARLPACGCARHWVLRGG